MHPTLPAADEERGFTLIEVLVTVALLSIAFIGILTAVAAMITAGAENTHFAASGTAVRNLAAFMQTPAQAYVNCNAPPLVLNAYNSELSTFVAPTGFAASVVGVQSWNGDSPATFVAAKDGSCPAGGDHNLQLLTIQIAPTGTQLGTSPTRTLTVLKRHP